MTFKALTLILASLAAPRAHAEIEPITPDFGLPEIQRLGTYEIAGIELKTVKGRYDLCRPGPERYADCGRRVWAVRLDGELALIRAQDDPRELKSWLLAPSFAQNVASCEDQISLWDARNYLFCSRFCRAFRAKPAPGDKLERFAFDQRIAFSTLAWQGAGLGLVLDPMIGIGQGSEIGITFAKGSARPAQILVHELTHAIALVFPTSFERNYTLRRVGD